MRASEKSVNYILDPLSSSIKIIPNTVVTSPIILPLPSVIDTELPGQEWLTTATRLGT